MRWHRSRFLLPILGLIAVSCQGVTEDPTSGEGDAGSEGVSEKLVVAELFGPERDWAIESGDAFVLTRYGIAETLVRVDFEGHLEPWLAQSWERVDELTWAIELREGLSFQDGAPLNADAVVEAWTFVLNTPTPPRGFSPEVLTNIEATDDNTVIVRTSAPDALFPLRLANPPTAILSPNAYGDSDTPDPFGTGTGPFILTESVRDQFFTLVANKDYWGGTVGLEEVEVQIVTDGQVRSGMAQSREAHIVRHIPIPMVPVIGGLEGVTLIADPEPRTETLYFNIDHPVLSDKRVRQAISHAVDNDLLATDILEGAADPAIGPFPETQPWARPGELTTYQHDPERARDLLAEAGYEDGDLKFEMLTSSRLSYFIDMAVTIQRMLADVGITVELRVMEYSALEPDVLAGNYDIFLGSRGHLLDMNDPLGFLEADYTCDGAYNLSQFCDSDVEAMLAEAATIEEDEQRWEIYGEVTEYLQSEAISHFIVYSNLFTAVENGIENVRHHPLNHYVLTPEIVWNN